MSGSPLRNRCAKTEAPGGRTAGTVGALPGDHMSADRIEGWTIPLHVVMWTALLVALVMVITVVLMN